jgi:hypothetical protein
VGRCRGFVRTVVIIRPNDRAENNKLCPQTVDKVGAVALTVEKS